MGCLKKRGGVLYLSRRSSGDPAHLGNRESRSIEALVLCHFARPNEEGGQSATLKV